MEKKMYVAKDETTGGLYDNEQLIEVIATIAKPIDLKGRDGIQFFGGPKFNFFEIIGPDGQLYIISTNDLNRHVGISSNDETARLIKSELEALAVSLRLEELN